MTTLDATGTALLAAVRANPDSDLERLVYADWLDDHPGQYERFRCMFCRRDSVRCVGCAALNATAAARDAALIREQIATGTERDIKAGLLSDRIGGVVRRGFLDEVRGPLADLLRELPRLVRLPNAAVTRATVTDRRPTGVSSCRRTCGGSWSAGTCGAAGSACTRPARRPRPTCPRP